MLSFNFSYKEYFDCSFNYLKQLTDDTILQAKPTITNHL